MWIKSKNLITSSLTMGNSLVSTILRYKWIMFLSWLQIKIPKYKEQMLTKMKLPEMTKYNQIPKSTFTYNLFGKSMLRILSSFSVIYFSERMVGSNPPIFLNSFLLPGGSSNPLISVNPCLRRFNRSSTFPNISWASCNANLRPWNMKY